MPLDPFVVRSRVAARWHWIRCCGFVFLLVLLLQLPAQAAERAPLVLTGPVDAQTLGRHFSYRLDPDWSLRAEDFSAASAVAMQPLAGDTPDFGYTPARIWLRVRVLNHTAEDSWRFVVHANFTQRIAIYRIAADGRIATLLELTEDSPFAARPLPSPRMVAPLQLAPGEAATLLVAYYSQGASRLSMSLQTHGSYAAEARVYEAKNYAFYGMMLVMVALASVALLLLRQPVFAAYAAYLVSVLLYIAHADGSAFQILWPDFPRFNAMASVLAGSGVMVCGALFAMSLLQTARFHPRMHRVLQALVVLVLATDLLLWWSNPQLLKRLLVFMILASVLCFVSAAVVAARQRLREVRFYLLSWCAGLVPVALFTARFAFGMEPSFITPYDAIRIALALDALLMGLAIFDRYNFLRQTAMQEALDQARRNADLGQRLALLEQRYAQAAALTQEHEEHLQETVHDLRQPMHALRLSLRRLFSGQAGEADDAAQVEAALGYMEQLVGARLAARPAADAPPAPHAPHARMAEPGLHAVLHGVIDMFDAEAAERGLALRLVLAASDGPVAAYPLMRAVANLVSNAIKYTAQGQVLVALRRCGSGHRVEVHDTGPGLRGAAFEQALQRHQRLARDLQVAEGSGLGLAVVDSIVQANGWRLRTCDRRRTGASICIVLPGTGP